MTERTNERAAAYGVIGERRRERMSERTNECRIGSDVISQSVSQSVSGRESKPAGKLTSMSASEGGSE